MESKKTRRQPVGASHDKKRRIPIADRRDRLWFPKDPKYHRVIVNDEYLEDYLKSGFDHVKYEDLEESDRRYLGQGNIINGSELGAFVRWNVGRARNENTTGWLLQIPKSEYREIKKLMNEERQAPMKDLQRSINDMKSAGYYGDAEIK